MGNRRVDADHEIQLTDYCSSVGVVLKLRCQIEDFDFARHCVKLCDGIALLQREELSALHLNDRQERAQRDRTILILPMACAACPRQADAKLSIPPKPAAAAFDVV